MQRLNSSNLVLRAASNSARRGLAMAASRSVARRPLQARNFITVIEQGHEAWRLTLGRDPVRLSPGLNLSIPIWHTVTNVDMREGSIQIPDLSGYTSDNVPVKVSGSLFYKIFDSYKACFHVSDVHSNVRNTGMSACRSVIGSFTYDQIINNRNELNRALDKVIGDTITSWGVNCTRFEIQTFQPANREVERQLELQMEAERNRRKQLLDTQAHINVAEGHKQRVILESEGHLEAKSNEADAAFKTVVREAEARKEQALLEASALASQIEAIATSLAKDGAAPSVEDRKTASNILVELKRLEQLKAIAGGNGNSTYFFGDQSVMGMGKGAGEAYGIDYAERVKEGVKTGKKTSESVVVGGVVAQ